MSSAGQRLWNFSADDTLKPVFSSPTMAGGRIYIGEGYHQDQHCRLLCLDARNGQVLWAKQTESHVESSPCVLGPRIFFGAGDDGILCVDESVLEPAGSGPPSPKTLWRLPGYHVDSAPLVIGDLLFAGSVVGDIHRVNCALAVDIHTGQLAWRVPAPMPVPGSPAYSDGRVFFGLGNGKMTEDAESPQGALWCLDAKTGRRLWQFDAGSSVLATPATDKDRVYFAARSGLCYCLRQQDGEIVWKSDQNSPIAASLTVAGGKIYGITVSGKVFCLTAATGQELWRLNDLVERANGEAVASPVLANGRLYVAAGGQVYCIGDE
jgi:outer membrane protein assembly factor BamB